MLGESLSSDALKLKDSSREKKLPKRVGIRTECENHINDGHLFSEATLRLGLDTFRKLLQSLQSTSGERLPPRYSAAKSL